MDNSSCFNTYQNESYPDKYCKIVFDDYLCWGPTEPGTNVSQNCPFGKGLDATKLAWRSCSENGTWHWANRPELIDQGYTNYTECFNGLLRKLLDKCEGVGLNVCQSVAAIARRIEMIGLFLSFFSLILSLIIFYRYRVLRNNRTTIHKNLFLATLFQVIIRLIIYTDEKLETSQMERIAYLCEAIKVLLEFSKIATIMWMFVEGLYLHNAITVTVFQEHTYIKLYCYVGWTFPMILTFIWILAMINTDPDKCWFLYNFLPNYWILEGPSSALIIINMLFLLNIIRILVMKLRESRIGEIQQVKKAVRAAIFLVPLMGTTNILFMIDCRVFEDKDTFALWTYTSHFFISFQGFFIATIYCFLNGEVRDAVKNTFYRYMSLRQDQMIHRRNSTEATRLSTQDCEP